MTETTRERWGIVGGGLLGMTLARRLRQQGKSVTLFEAAAQLGGLASAWEVGGIIWDRHYHVSLLSDSRLRSLLAELNLEQSMQWVETRTGFYTDGRLYSMSNTLEFLRFPPLGLLDKVRLGATIMYASRVRSWQRLETIAATDWLARWSGKHTFEKIWLPLLRAKLGENYAKASAAFIWAIIARMYAARRTGLKKEMFGYVPGGYARILGCLTDRLVSDGVAIRLGCKASRVQRMADAKVRIQFTEGLSETFDHVILTLPAPLIAGLCPQLSAEERERLAGIPYQGVLCASLLLKQPLSPYYVTNITEPWVPFTAVIDMAALVDRRHFGGHALVYLPRYLDANDPLFGSSDEEIKATSLQALERMYPSFQRRDLLAFRVSRVRHVLAIPTLHYSRRVPAMATSLPGVHIVNSAQIVNGTLNANETIQLGEQAAARLMTLPSMEGGTCLRRSA